MSILTLLKEKPQKYERLFQVIAGLSSLVLAVALSSLLGMIFLMVVVSLFFNSLAKFAFFSTIGIVFAIQYTINPIFTLPAIKDLINGTSRTLGPQTAIWETSLVVISPIVLHMVFIVVLIVSVCVLHLKHEVKLSKLTLRIAKMFPILWGINIIFTIIMIYICMIS